MCDFNSPLIDGWINLLKDPRYLEGQRSTRASYEHELDLLRGVFTYYRNYENDDFASPILERHFKRCCAREKTGVEEIRFLSVQEQDQFIAILGGDRKSCDLAKIQFEAGLRIGEAAALDSTCIDHSREELIVKQHLHWKRYKGSKTHLLAGTKTGPCHRVPLTPKCHELLLARERDYGKIFFSGDDNGWISYRTIQSAYDRAFEKLELEHRGTHVMRHTFAVRFLEQTQDIYALKEVLGHKDLRTTQVYAKYTNESVRRSFKLFSGGKKESEIRAVAGDLVSRSFHAENRKS